MNSRIPKDEPDAHDRANIATFARLEKLAAGQAYTVISDTVYEPPVSQPPPEGFCRVYWGSHGCHHPRGHPAEVPHECDCCTCQNHPDPDPDNPGNAPSCVAGPPYYGAHTRYYGEEAEAPGLPLVTP